MWDAIIKILGPQAKQHIAYAILLVATGIYVDWSNKQTAQTEANQTRMEFRQHWQGSPGSYGGERGGELSKRFDSLESKLDRVRTLLGDKP